MPRPNPIGCVLAVLFTLAVPVAVWFVWNHYAEEEERRALEAQEKEAKEEFAPALEKLDAASAEQEAPYDIDQTVRVIHEIDLAMKDRASMKEYVSYLAQQDYRGVSPDVLASRRQILATLERLYAKQTEAEDQRAMWELTSELLLSTLSVVSVSGELGPVNTQGGFSVDRAQAQQLLADLKEERSEQKKLVHDVTELESELFTALFDYSDVYYRHVEEWDRLCTLRDRAYLGVQNRDWETARASADAAIAMAPREKEAHLLKALALIEGGKREDWPEAERLLAGYVEDHPDSSAPAFLLLGVVEQKEGHTEAARLHFQQSAAYYPKQADQLTEMLNPYKMRTFLRKSREGGYIVELYKSTMLGAGYFSPDLQLAKAAFDAGEFDVGKQKVLDHFARRRGQEQWDFILSDLKFASELLGEPFREIFPEDAYLDLVVEPKLFGSNAIHVSVSNRSDKTLRNATLILAIHFTDMVPGDYETFTAERTIPAVLPHEVTDFGTVTVATELWGKPKSVQDIVQHRAILVTDEAVLWVDTDEFKIAEAKEFHDAAAAGRPVPEQKTTAFERMSQGFSELPASLGTASLDVEPRYGFNDDFVVELPSKLAVFRPIFTLKYGGQTFKAESNVIDGDRIVLRFEGVDNLDAKEPAPKDAELQIHSVFGDIVVGFSPNGATTYRVTAAR